MILGLGVDLCPVARIAEVIKRHEESFVNRVFTASEREYANAARTDVRVERLAARFAAKEAVIKALGAPSGLRWQEMEVAKEADGSPRLCLYGRALEQANRLGVERSWLSLTHAGGVAVAVVIFEGEK